MFPHGRNHCDVETNQHIVVRSGWKDPPDQQSTTGYREDYENGNDGPERISYHPEATSGI